RPLSRRGASDGASEKKSRKSIEVSVPEPGRTASQPMANTAALLVRGRGAVSSAGAGLATLLVQPAGRSGTCAIAGGEPETGLRCENEPGCESGRPERTEAAGDGLRGDAGKAASQQGGNGCAAL